MGIDEDAFKLKKQETEANIAVANEDIETLKDQMAALPDMNTMLELIEILHFYQAGLLLEDEPFELRRDWVEAFDVCAVLLDEGKQRRMKISCALGLSQDVLIETSLPKSSAPHNSKSRWPASSRNLNRWRSALKRS